MAMASLPLRFTSHDQVIDALRRLPAHYDPRTASVIRLPRGGGSAPFNRLIEFGVRFSF